MRFVASRSDVTGHDSRLIHSLSLLGRWAAVAGALGLAGVAWAQPSQAACTPPVNDSCSAPRVVQEGVFSFSTVCATTDGLPEFQCSQFSDEQVHSDLWFRYAPTCNGLVRFSTCGSTFDTKLMLYAFPANCPTFRDTAWGCNDDGCGSGSMIETYLEANRVVLIRLGGSNGQQGTGNLTIENTWCPPPANDNCANAIDVSAAGQFAGDLTGATTDNAVGISCGSSASRDVWYRYTACGTGTFWTSTCGTHDTVGIDSTITVFSGCGGTVLACDDDNSGECGHLDSGARRDAYVQMSVTAGTTYTIRVGHYVTSPLGPFRLNIGFYPSNDNCAGVRPVLREGNNPFCLLGGATYFATEFCGQPLNDVWFDYTAVRTGPVRLSTCHPSTNFDTMLAVYNTCPTSSDQAIACGNDDPSCSPTRNSTVTFNAVAGRTYPIRLGTRVQNAIGSGVLIVDGACPADISGPAGTPNPDGGVDVGDLLFFLASFEAGNAYADLDNGGGSGTPDGGVDVGDLIFLLHHFEGGC